MKKLTTLTYADKLKAIEAVKNGLKRKVVAAQFGIHENFVTCNDEVVIAGTLTEEEILESVNNCIESDKDDDFNDEPQTSSTSVSINEAKRALTTVRSFIEQCSNIKDNVFSSLFVIENQIDLETVNCLKQKKITFLSRLNL
ncbi:hypothetical protein RN001_005909 [Aquatica leii]|uniref:Uncharacterized protein n=1 Tax=Aquatica leii TaxID=1421715 RepID=A0AAN7Q8E8_9COLE|nr:hypothetical protein RN001_005909 [Aquatica leii]